MTDEKREKIEEKLADLAKVRRIVAEETVQKIEEVHTLEMPYQVRHDAAVIVLDTILEKLENDMLEGALIVMERISAERPGIAHLRRVN